ncbi:hypothetical protein N7493_002875 [Penicillium malachiteum]|uniref:Zn(2)-C6 fungal-type domain-containing protein n=1 Tax=Penicillium malachiteum TaxID=1324776 RepID=A0AAD6HSR3_9EURO|nr:hypothetical protein N7493_002875 [Penicillium malachiteum]
MPKACNLALQRRARAVCIRCHRRKVRCDLENQQNGTCSRCQQEGHECRPHIGPRKEKALRNCVRSPRIEDQVLSATPERTTASPLTDLETLRRLYCSSTQSDFPTEQRNFIKGSELILEVNQAAHLPPSAITQALSDFYFRELFHFVPVIDHGQAELESSVLLQQCLCFAGSTMRQSTEPREWSPTAIYGRIKTLLFLNYDPISINTLTALCVLSTWLSYSPEMIVLDSPWQWTGMGIRLALQLQLHEDKTYEILTNPGRARRAWWYLFNNDTMQMACSGRPGMFPLKESHVRLPEITDFDNPTTGARVFCSLTALCKVLRHILELGQAGSTPQDEIYTLSKQLCLWRECLPPELQLFDPTRKTRLSYSRSVVELHIFYLAIMILICFLNHRENPLLFKYVSVAASSCISRLYEEILFHEEVTYLLPIHSWANLVASIPRTFGDINTLNPDRAKESKISRDVLTKMSEKHSSAAMVLNRINSPVDGDPIVFSAQNEPMTSLPVPIPDDKTQHLFSLFHFPEKFCPTLDLLRSADQAANCQLDSQPEWTMDDSGSWPIDWSLFLFDAPMSF